METRIPDRIPVDGEKVKETVGTARAVTKLLYHHFVSVLTQETGFFAQGVLIFFLFRTERSVWF